MSVRAWLPAVGSVCVAAAGAGAAGAGAAGAGAAGAAAAAAAAAIVAAAIVVAAEDAAADVAVPAAAAAVAVPAVAADENSKYGQSDRGTAAENAADAGASHSHRSGKGTAGDAPFVAQKMRTQQPLQPQRQLLLLLRLRQPKWPMSVLQRFQNRRWECFFLHPLALWAS